MEARSSDFRPTSTNNFLDCIDETLGADVDSKENLITYRGRVTRVRSYPVGVESDAGVLRTTPPSTVCRERACKDLDVPPGTSLGVGVDRLDYTKGIPQKFFAIERLLESCPDLQGRFTFLQIAEPSRDGLSAYQEARRRVLEVRDHVNRRFGSRGVLPIRLLEAHHEADAVYRFYRAADLCYVGSLRDGMNLVAKEFVSARSDGRGVLLLSRRAGAARQLAAALQIDPLDIDAAARALHQALTMSDQEQSARMRMLRSVVRASSTESWSQRLLKDVDCEFTCTLSRRVTCCRPENTVQTGWL